MGLLLLLLTFLFMLGGVMLIVDLFDYEPWVVANLVINAIGLIPLTVYIALLSVKTVRLARHGPDRKQTIGSDSHPPDVSTIVQLSENILRESVV